MKGNGLDVSARRTVQELLNQGQEVRVLTGEPLPGRSVPIDVPAYTLKEFHFPIFQGLIHSQGYSFAKNDQKIIEEAVRWADVIHLEEEFPVQTAAIRYAKKYGKPLTATFHLHPENITFSLGMGTWHWVNKAILNYWKRNFFNHCMIVQCPTENVSDRLCRYHIKAASETISNGVIPDECIRPLTPPENYFDENRPLDVLCVGRYSKEKDQLTLLEAMRYSRFKSRIRLHFAGQGPELARYERLSKRLMKEGVLNYEPVFAFHTRDELRQLAASADLLIHCATIEVEGLSIMEALQQGVVPVIALSRYSGTPQFALDRKSKFPSQNPEALAKRIDYWLSHPKERWETGLRYVEEMKKYDIQESVKMLVKMFETVIAQSANKEKK